jgi:hypothetical protein
MAALADVANSRAIIARAYFMVGFLDENVKVECGCR